MPKLSHTFAVALFANVLGGFIVLAIIEGHRRYAPKS